MASKAEYGTPVWWLETLKEQLEDRATEIRRCDSYYDGNHPLPDAPKGAKEAYHRFLKQSRSNWMALVVDAVTERLHVDGFRFGEATSGDADAWKIWQTNHLDADSELVHVDAFSRGLAYVLVDPHGSAPVITPEDALECCVAYMPGDRRHRAAGLKLWAENDGMKATVFLPDATYKFETEGKSKVWVERRGADDNVWPLPNKLGKVPLVEFRANPRTRGGGRSEFFGVTDIQDRINETLYGRLVAMQFSSFRQRWATGLEIPEDPDTGKPLEPYKAAVDRLWVSENPDVKFGEFSESDQSGYIRAVEADVQHLAAITRTPPHYLLGQSGAFPSGESLKATETGLVSKVRRHQRQIGESWEEVIRLALEVAGDDRYRDEQSEVIWHDPESRSEGEMVDALVKMETLGVPHEVLWQRWGASPQEVARWKAMKAADVFRSTINQPPAPVTPVAPAPVAAP